MQLTDKSFELYHHINILTPIVWRWEMMWLPATIMRLLNDLRFLLEGKTLISGRSLTILCRGCGTGGMSCRLRLAVAKTLLSPAADVAIVDFWSSDCNHWAATSCADSCSCSGRVGGTSPRTIMWDSPLASPEKISIHDILIFIILITISTVLCHFS